MRDGEPRLLMQIMMQAEGNGERDLALYVANILALAERAGED